MEIDRNAPATKGDLADLEVRLDERIEMLRSEVHTEMQILRTEVNHGYDDLRELIRDSQTELLKAFYSFAQSNNKRQAEMESNQAHILSRLSTVEDRLLELERRVITPPPQ